MYYSKKTVIGRQSKINYIKGLARDNTFEYGYTRVEEGAEKIKEDILNLLDISKRELFFAPEVGSSLDNFLFEPNTFVLRDLITSCLTTEVEANIPNVKVLMVEVDQDFDFHYVSIRLEYQIISMGLVDSLEVTRYIKEKLDFS